MNLQYILLPCRFINHCFYWSVISPNPSTAARTPGGALSVEITTTFGSFETFKSAFSTSALDLFGSGMIVNRKLLKKESWGSGEGGGKGRRLETELDVITGEFN